MKASNAAELLSEPDVDGALVGGASLVAEDFCGIVRGAAADAGAGALRGRDGDAAADRPGCGASHRCRGCPAGFRCAPDYPAEGDRIAAGLFLERCAAGADPRPFGAYLVCSGQPPIDIGVAADPALVIGGIGFHGRSDGEAGWRSAMALSRRSSATGTRPKRSAS